MHRAKAAKREELVTRTGNSSGEQKKALDGGWGTWQELGPQMDTATTRTRQKPDISEINLVVFHSLFLPLHSATVSHCLSLAVKRRQKAGNNLINLIGLLAKQRVSSTERERAVARLSEYHPHAPGPAGHMGVQSKTAYSTP